ncbi:MAG: PIG-L deacetylase family protein [Frankiaceae bacterium]
MEPLSEDWQRAAVIVAHPDDIEFGVSSAVARWTRRGKDVAYVLASRGEAGIAALPPEQVAPLREEEQRNSAAVVGVRQIEYLDFADGAIEYGLALRRDLAAAIRRLRPDIVITANFDLTWGSTGNVNHADHRAVGLATLDACRDAANPWSFPEMGQAWGGIQAAYVGGSNEPTHFVDVEETLNLGVASLQEHRAYLDGLGRDLDPAEFLRSFTRASGTAAGCRYAVLFREYHPV